MSARSIRRNHERAVRESRRRNARRARRASIAAGAALGATVMFAPAAEAATFEVNTLNDAAADGCTTDPDGCTLRDAVTDANANGEDDVITFASGLSGEIVLTQGELLLNNGFYTEIAENGTDQISVSGNGNSRIFHVDQSNLAIRGLDLTDGYIDGDGGAIYQEKYSFVSLDDVTVTSSEAADDGGGISVESGRLEVTDSEITGNLAGDEGGGVYLQAFGGKYGLGDASLEMSNSLVSGNTADDGGGIFGSKYSQMDIETSEIASNAAPGGGGGGIVSVAGTVDIDASEIVVNIADGPGGGISAKYADLLVTDTTIAGNESGGAAGVAIFGIGGSDQGPGTGPDVEIRRSTIAGNVAQYSGGGIGAAYISAESSVLVAQSTVSGNTAGDGDGTYSGPRGGGGFAIYGDTYGQVEFSNSTISGNTAELGGGVSVDRPEFGGGGGGGGRREVPAEGDGSLEFNNTTIADNTAEQQGGGVYLGYYAEYDPDAQEVNTYQAVVPLSSTIVADNTADGAANDLAQATGIPGGGFALNYSLVETPGSAAVTQDPAGQSILGVDPQLGNLADNGGPTLTHLPGASSPVVDQGVDNATARDQRGERRTVDLAPTNNPADDATDIGAVEIQDGPPPTEPETRPLTADEIPPNCELTLSSAGLALGGTDKGQTINGSDEDDILRGFGGADTVVGRGGDDCLTGDDDDDTIRGKAGDDLALGGDDRDFMKGNGGDDEFRGNGGRDRIKLAGGKDRGAGGGGDDNVAAGNGDDKIKGNAGDDRLFGNDGDDQIKGGSGDDVIYGGGGKNDINCGSGDDKVIVNGHKDNIAANCEIIKIRGHEGKKLTP